MVSISRSSISTHSRAAFSDFPGFSFVEPFLLTSLLIVHLGLDLLLHLPPFLSRLQSSGPPQLRDRLQLLSEAGLLLIELSLHPVLQLSPGCFQFLRVASGTRPPSAAALCGSLCLAPPVSSALL